MRCTYKLLVLKILNFSIDLNSFTWINKTPGKILEWTYIKNTISPKETATNKYVRQKQLLLDTDFKNHREE